MTSSEVENDRTDDTLKEVHEVLLDMMSDIDEFCQRHNLRYWIFCGTLLGAVREHNFIPWDDDADLAMPIEDYRKFCRLALRELSDKYVIQTPGNTPQHPWLWTRVYRKGTTFLRWDRANQKICHGIALDVYPLIGVANSRSGFMFQQAILTLSSALHRVEFWRAQGYPPNKWTRLTGRILMLVPEPLRRALSMGALRLASLSPKRTKRSCTLDLSPLFPKFKLQDLEPYTMLELAGRKFAAPKNYHSALCHMYGTNYMTPPPETARNGHRARLGGVVIDAKRDYTEYLKERAEQSARKE